MTNLKGVIYLATQGVHQTLTYPNYRYPAIKGWTDGATTNLERIHELAAKYPDYNWCSVAKAGYGACIIDIDDIAWAQANGFPFADVDSTFIVDTPKGGCHVYLWQTPELTALGNTTLVDQGGTVVELKVHNTAVASCLMYRNDKEPSGYYRHRRKAEIITAPQSVTDWFKAHKPKAVDLNALLPKQFHPDFDRDDYCDHYGFDLNGHEKVVNGVLFCYCPCPFKDGEYHTANGGGEALGCTAITFGSRIGFFCYAHPDKTFRDVLALRKEQGYHTYPEPVYVTNDPDLIFAVEAL